MPEQQPTLRDMINDATARGATYAQLEARAIDPATGRNGASGGYINRLANGKVDKIPTAGHLRALAAALGVTYERVRQAAIYEWLPPETPEVDVAAERAELRAEALRLKEIAEDALARADAALARSAREANADDGGRAESA